MVGEPCLKNTSCYTFIHLFVTDFCLFSKNLILRFQGSFSGSAICIHVRLSFCFVLGIESFVAAKHMHFHWAISNWPISLFLLFFGIFLDWLWIILALSFGSLIFSSAISFYISIVFYNFRVHLSSFSHLISHFFWVFIIYTLSLLLKWLVSSYFIFSVWLFLKYDILADLFLLFALICGTFVSCSFGYFSWDIIRFVHVNFRCFWLFCIT
jgi:hypothetical protein